MNPEHPNRSPSREGGLFREGEILSRYLVDESVSQNFLERYIRANGILFPDVPGQREDPVVFFVCRYPWSLPFLDAVLGILHPQAVLRKKLLLMVALLEAAPDYTNYFIPERVPVFQFWLKVARFGMTSLLKIVIGLCLYPFAVKLK